MNTVPKTSGEEALPSDYAAPSAPEGRRPTAFLVVAYRWGWTNAHHYFVALCENEDLASKRADEEASDRGGKYGVAVYAWTGSDDHERVYYAPSTYGESQPGTNQRIDMFQSIGHRAHEAATSGSVYLADPQNPQRLQSQVVQIPGWLDEVVRSQEHSCRLAQRIDDSILEASRAGANAQDVHNEAWFELAEKEIRAEVDSLMSHRDRAISAQASPWPHFAIVHALALAAAGTASQACLKHIERLVDALGDSEEGAAFRTLLKTLPAPGSPPPAPAVRGVS